LSYKYICFLQHEIKISQKIFPLRRDQVKLFTSTVLHHGTSFALSSARGTLRLTPLEPNFIGMKRVLYAEKVVERCGFDGKNYGISGTKHSIVFQNYKDE
jgi:hypothetical protein